MAPELTDHVQEKDCVTSGVEAPMANFVGAKDRLNKFRSSMTHAPEAMKTRWVELQRRPRKDQDRQQFVTQVAMCSGDFDNPFFRQHKTAEKFTEDAEEGGWISYAKFVTEELS